MKSDKKGVKPEVEKAKPAEGALADEDLEGVAGGVLPKWWLDGAAETLKKTDPDKIC